MRSRFLLVVPVLLAVMTLGACQNPAPIIVVVTATPGSEVTPEVTEAVTAESAAVEPTLAATAPSSTAQPPAGATAAPTNTALPPNFPTPVTAQISMAEQLFEGGRMFWLQPTGQIWVLHVTGEGRGAWTIYPDTFIDGEPESEPSLTPPAGLLQPDRGFGKLWREVPAVRDALGWAVTPEFGYTSAYEYHAGGTVDASGVYTPGPGYHILYSLYGERFRFNEADGTWQLGG
ncbi:MAG TPA: hypothetical protein VER79_01300 [Candidatus Limnocylindrales bacterium]|nr:hypothetical protein [Candidatus Limnocylindrales bacterium]